MGDIFFAAKTVYIAYPVSLSIALLGTRGVPARYGGFETFAEELGKRLVVRGHSVTVYGRRAFGAPVPEGKYLGIRTRLRPTIYTKSMETLVHAFTSVCDPELSRHDIVLLCNAANSPWCWIARLRGVPVVINVDGIERRRSKWGLLGRWWYRLGEIGSVLFASRIVADAEVIARYYQETYGAESSVIAYGAEEKFVPAGETLTKFGLEAGRYVLYVSRLEPENNALLAVKAFGRTTTDMKLVVVGDAPYAKEYIHQVRAAADSRVVFTGYQFGDAYRELRSHCRAYIQATEVGGVHPALLEAMAHGNPIVANDVPEHREVLQDAGLYYDFNSEASLAARLTELTDDDQLCSDLRRKAKERVRSTYAWDVITDQYETLLTQCAKRRTRSQV